MSWRNAVGGNDALVNELRDLRDRVHRLENGGATAGKVSFDSVIRIGDVEIAVVLDANANLVFTDVRTGSTYTIVI